ncbi:MAG: hypothetical protein COB51_08890 [Moraxellaceae bacterium]|nr:MAG: hypothetical protein COB51_08890 [Moraxellaceae bacterium]
MLLPTEIIKAIKVGVGAIEIRSVDDEMWQIMAAVYGQLILFSAIGLPLLLTLLMSAPSEEIERQSD